MKFPIFISGKVIRGFGRGSKELGIPTANFPREVVDANSSQLNTGIYYGWAKVDDGDVHKMVMCVGWNPYYRNEHKSIETHIIHKFKSDFYGATLKICILGYIREEKSFDSLEALINEINNDVRISEKELEKPEWVAYRNNEFFH